MPNCKICGRHINEGEIGPICSRKRLPDDPPAITPRPALKAFFMSRPNSTAADRRSWLVRSPATKESWLVRIFPDADGRIAVCDCERSKTGERCEHIEFISPIDARKFNVKEIKQNESE